MITKDEILALLKPETREGMKSLIDWMVHESDYFTAPASTKYHGNYSGGLADHSLNVYDSLSLLNKEFRETPYNEDTIIIVSLLHDLCKCHYYVLDEESASSKQIDYLRDLVHKADGDLENMPADDQRTKGYVTKLIDFYKNGGDRPEFSETFKVDEQFPMGHGEKSLYLIQKHIKLTDAEALAIRWHLGSSDPGAMFFYPSGAPLQAALNKYPLVSLLTAADYLASWQVDVKK